MTALKNRIFIIMLLAVFAAAGCGDGAIAKEAGALLEGEYAEELADVKSAAEWHESFVEEQEKMIREDKEDELDQKIGMAIARSMQQGIDNSAKVVEQQRRELTGQIVEELRKKGLVGDDKKDAEKASRIVWGEIQKRLRD